MPLQSGVWNNKSIKELMLERKKLGKEYSNNYEQYQSASAEWKNLIRAKDLDNKLSDKSLNGEMKQIMKFFESFFWWR